MTRLSGSLLNAQRDITNNAVNERLSNYSALMWAVNHNDVENAKLLLTRKGPDANSPQPGMTGSSAFHMCLNRSFVDIAKLFLSDDPFALETGTYWTVQH